MRQLGGWWRLWIVVATVWALIALTVLWPSRGEVDETIFSGDELTDGSVDQWRRGAGSECLLGTLDVRTKIKVGNPFDEFSDAVPAVTTMSAEPWKNDPMAGTPERYMVASASCVDVSRVREALFVALGIPLALLLFGFAFGWVRAGFR